MTENQQEWNKEYKNLKRRVKSWVKKFHAVVELPQKPDRIYNKDIERLKQTIWKNLSETEKKQARKEYEYRYENKIPEIYIPKPPYKPPTEQDFYNDITLEELEYEKQFVDDNWYEEPDEDGYTETVVSRDEIEAWIDANINTIIVDRELDGVREQLNNLVFEAADAYGDYGEYLNYLEEHASQLNNLAQKAMSGYRGKNGKIYQEDSSALSEFATVLNLSRPLTQSQAERFENEGWVSYDFND